MFFPFNGYRRIYFKKTAVRLAKRANIEIDTGFPQAKEAVSGEREIMMSA